MQITYEIFAVGSSAAGESHSQLSGYPGFNDELLYLTAKIELHNTIMHLL